MNLKIIKDFSKNNGVSIKWVAEQIGMSPENLRLNIKKNKIQAQDLEKIAQILRVDIREFFDQDPDLTNIDGSINQAGKNNTQNVKSIVTSDTQYMAKIMKLKTENKYQKEMIEKLEEQIRDKEEIIELLKGK